MEKNYTARQFGSLYFNGKSQTISSNPQDFKYEPGMTITIGDTQPFGCAIPWIKPKGQNSIHCLGATGIRGWDSS